MSTVTKFKRSAKYLMLLLMIPAYKLGVEFGKLEVQHKIRGSSKVRVFVSAACGELAEDAPNFTFVDNGLHNECLFRDLGKPASKFY